MSLIERFNNTKDKIQARLEVLNNLNFSIGVVKLPTAMNVINRIVVAAPWFAVSSLAECVLAFTPEGLNTIDKRREQHNAVIMDWETAGLEKASVACFFLQAIPVLGYDWAKDSVESIVNSFKSKQSDDIGPLSNTQNTTIVTIDDSTKQIFKNIELTSRDQLRAEEKKSVKCDQPSENNIAEPQCNVENTASVSPRIR